MTDPTDYSTLPCCDICHCVLDENGECECGLPEEPDADWYPEEPLPFDLDQEGK